MGISRRKYAEHRGVSHTAVNRALKTGRITLEPDRTIDPVKADKFSSIAARMDACRQSF